MTSQKAGNFLVQEIITPTSDVTDDASSGDDVSSCGTSSGGGDPSVEQRLYIINRAGSGEASFLRVTGDGQHIASYRLRTEVWPPIRDLTHFGVAVLRNHLYIIGGFDRRHARHLDRLVRFDPSEGTWTSCAPMTCARAKFGVCTSGSRIFVCGGEKSDGRVTRSCEVYESDGDSWSKAAVLPQPRANPVCTSHRKELYCAGGYHGNASHNNLWLHENHQWGEVDPLYPHLLPLHLDRCAVATHDDTIYFLGGVSSKARDGDQRPRFSTERRVFSYTTSVSALTSHPAPAASHLISPWNLKLPPLNHARQGAGAVTLGHKIYVVGGTVLETGQQVRIAEYMDTRTGMWEDDFNFRKGDVSNVACTLLAVPKIPVGERKMAYRLKWVMW
ncbi:hypothetical protein ACOMHN_066082 [Nucella lapillus]